MATEPDPVAVGKGLIELHDAKAEGSCRYFAKLGILFSLAENLLLGDDSLAEELACSAREGLLTDYSTCTDSSYKALLAQEKAATWLMKYDARQEKADVSLTMKDLTLVSAFIRSVHTLTDPGFVPKTTAMINGAPPAGVPCAAVGMDPKAMHDVGLRARYQAAIDEDARKTNLMQTALRRIASRMSYVFPNSVQKIANRHRLEASFVRKLLMDASTPLSVVEGIQNSISKGGQ
jgi:hypothetical protein